MNERVKFWLILGLNALAFVGLAAFGIEDSAFFLVSTVFWWEKDHALKYKRISRGYNTIKARFAAKGNLESYRSFATALYYIALGLGVFGVIQTVFEKLVGTV